LTFGFQRRVHENVIKPLLEGGGVFHAHLDGREHVVPAARRRKVKRRRNLTQVVQHRFLAFGDVDREVQCHPGTHGDGKVTHPGHGQVGEHAFAKVESAAAKGVANAREDVAVAQHHTFGLARRARGVDEDCRALRRGVFDQAPAQIRLGGEPLSTLRLQLFP
jgi:hypothetical protein